MLLNHMHKVIAIPPKYVVSQVIGLPQGKERHSLSARVLGKETEFRRSKLLGREYFVSTVERDEALIREYIRNQEQEDGRLEQLNLWR